MTVGLLLICARCYLEWRKEKQNATREDRSTVAISKSARIPWRISPKTEPLADAGDRMGLTRVHGQPFLFAIARDARTIFASWNIDWRSVFENAMPADRQVHLRVIGDGIKETRVAVEPMSAMQYLTISSLHDSYRVEIGYFQPFDTWHSVAMSQEVEIPPQESVG